MQTTTIFTKCEQALSEHFTATAWVKSIVPNDNIFNIIIANVTFEPSTRNY